MASHHQVQESEIKSFVVYCPELGSKEGTEHQKVLFYYPDNIPLNRKVRNVGLCEALVNFSKTFSSEKPCEIVDTQKTKQAFYQPEPGIWMTLSFTIPCSETIHNSERILEYHDHYIQDSVIQSALIRAYNMFRLFNGTMKRIEASQSVEGLKKRLDQFYSKYLKTIDVNKLDIFSVLQGIPFLPLDKYMYLKIHCFVNLVQTTFRQVKKTMFIFGEQLVWSGLDQADTKIFYHYLYSVLLRQNPSSEPTSSSTQSLMSSITPSASLSSSSSSANAGRFVIGEVESEGESRSSWVYVTINEQLTACRLYVYAVGSTVLCMFVQSDLSGFGGDDLVKRLGVFLGPRLSHLRGEIKEFMSKNKPYQGLDKQYKMVYFNEMNLAIKSPLMSRSIMPITPEMMCLLVQINAEYNVLEEGETIIRTLADYWIVARKNGHRRFFVIFTQKDVNFAEVNEEVRKLCQREFSNIYFFD